MAGVLFIVCIPNEEQEKTLSFKYRKKSDCEANGDQVYANNVNDKFTKNSVNNKGSPEKLVRCQTECKIHVEEDETKKAVTRSKSEDLINDHNEKSPLSSPQFNKSWENLKDAFEAPTRDNGIIPKETKIVDELHPNEHESMVKILEDILKRLNIENASWAEKNDCYLQVTFLLESSRCEKTLAILYEYGIGQRYKSIVSVVPCSVFYEGTEHSDKEEDGDEKSDQDPKKEQVKNTAWNRFLSSVRARLTVAQVVEGVKASASLTFDYVALLIVAAMVCAIGLVENSNVYLVSSMLISPLMGPVLAGTFGTVIQDRNLQKMGLQNELIGIGAAILVGFGYGLIICLGSNRLGESWPTPEMISRGELKTLWVGGIVAVLSGAAVALGILGDNIASLVGVAISTSLLPPAVNAGLFWSMAMVYGISGGTGQYANVISTGHYSEDCAWEYCALGGVSLCLTFVNVVCIYFAGIIVFKVKEVAPISRGQQRRFWKHDIKIARDYNKTLQNEEARNMRKLLSNEIAGLPKTESRNSIEEFTEQFRRSSEMFGDNVNSSVARPQYTWSPCTRTPARPSMKELEDLYLTLVHEKPPAHNRTLSFLIPGRGRSGSRNWGNITAPTLFEECDENGLPPIPEIPGSGPSIRSRYIAQNTPPSRITSNLFGTKKFIVTPAASDPLLDEDK